MIFRHPIVSPVPSFHGDIKASSLCLTLGSNQGDEFDRAKSVDVAVKQRALIRMGIETHQFLNMSLDDHCGAEVA